MSTPTYGAPHYAVIVQNLIPFITKDVWEVKLDGLAISTAGKNLIEVINSLKTSHGIFTDLEISPSVCFVKNTSSVDHVLEITYTGKIKLVDGKPAILTDNALIYDDGKRIEIALGGFNRATISVYPSYQKCVSYKDANLRKLHVSGNSYVVEIDGVRYTDPREVEADSSNEYGSVPAIISLNNLNNIIDCVGQYNVEGNYDSQQLINLDTVPHTVKVFIDKNKPIGNTNINAGPLTEVWKGKAIYVTDDNHIGSPYYGSVSNRKVDANGFSMTLAPAYLPPIVNEHNYEDVIDTRFESVVTLTGMATHSQMIRYVNELPELYVTIKIGEYEYMPDITVTDGVVEWSLTLTTKNFENVKGYTVTVSRLGGVNGYHTSAQEHTPVIINHFTTYDDLAATLLTGPTTVDKSTITLSLSELGISNTSGISYAAGTKSGSIPKTTGITINEDVLTINTFYGAYDTGNTGLINNVVGELALVNNNGTPAISLINNVDTTKVTPLYNTQFMDYAYVAVTGLGKEVFTLDMFSNTGSGHCVYLADQDINLWLLRI